MLQDYLALDTTGRGFVLEQLFKKNGKSLKKSNLINITTEISQYDSVVEDLEFHISVCPHAYGVNKLVLSDFKSYRRNCTNTSHRLKRFFLFLDQTFQDLIIQIDLRSYNLVEIKLDSNKTMHTVLRKLLGYKMGEIDTSEFKSYIWTLDHMSLSDYTYQLARILSLYEGSKLFNISHNLVNHYNDMEVSLEYQGYSTYNFEVEFHYIEDALNFIAAIPPTLDSRWEDTSRRTTQVKVGIEGGQMDSNIDYLIRAL
jgi:hypothetical protein